MCVDAWLNDEKTLYIINYNVAFAPFTHFRKTIYS